MSYVTVTMSLHGVITAVAAVITAIAAVITAVALSATVTTRITAAIMTRVMYVSTFKLPCIAWRRQADDSSCNNCEIQCFHIAK